MSLIDDFENSFQACLAPITNPISSHVLDSDELKANLDNIQRFLDISQQMESFFIRKRAILTDQKPEFTLSEEINELKFEIQRKDNLLNHYYEKLNIWSNVVNEALLGKSLNVNNLMLQENTSQVIPNIPGQPIRPSNMVSPQLNQNQHGMQHVQSPLMRPQSGGSGMIASPIQPINQSTSHPPSAAVFTSINNQMQYPANQNPLANLERTTAHIGMSDNRR